MHTVYENSRLDVLHMSSGTAQREQRVARERSYSTDIMHSWFQGTLACHNSLDLCTLPLRLCHSSWLLVLLSRSLSFCLSRYLIVFWCFSALVAELRSQQAYTSYLLMLYFNAHARTHSQFSPSIHPNLSPPQPAHSPAWQCLGYECVRMSEERAALPDLRWPPALLYSAGEVNICTQSWTAERCLRPSSLHSMKYS